MSTIANWASELEEVEIEAGDKVTFETESEVEKFDGEVTLTAAGSPNDDYWLEIEIPAEGVYLIVPDSDSDGGATFVQGSALRATGAIRNRRDVAEVHGIKEVED